MLGHPKVHPSASVARPCISEDSNGSNHLHRYTAPNSNSRWHSEAAKRRQDLAAILLMKMWRSSRFRSRCWALLWRPKCLSLVVLAPCTLLNIAASQLIARNVSLIRTALRIGERGICKFCMLQFSRSRAVEPSCYWTHRCGGGFFTPQEPRLAKHWWLDTERTRKYKYPPFHPPVRFLLISHTSSTFSTCSLQSPTALKQRHLWHQLDFIWTLKPIINLNNITKFLRS